MILSPSRCAFFYWNWSSSQKAPFVKCSAVIKISRGAERPRKEFQIGLFKFKSSFGISSRWDSELLESRRTCLGHSLKLSNLKCITIDNTIVFIWNPSSPIILSVFHVSPSAPNGTWSGTSSLHLRFPVSTSFCWFLVVSRLFPGFWKPGNYLQLSI